MTEVLLRLLRAARGSGVRISTAEALDAFRAAAAVGWSDRAVLRDALSLSLAKSVEEKSLFETCFDRYFDRRQIGADEADAPAVTPPAATSLGQMLLKNDQAGLAAALEAAGEAIGASTISLFTQTNLFARRMLDHMGLAELEREIADRRRDTPATADLLEAARAALGIQARVFMERQLNLFAAGAARETREHALRSVQLSQLDRRDIARMRALIRTLARRLATRHSRRRSIARRGRLDIRKTIRRNAGSGGVLFETVWRRHRIDRPKIMVLCDVSGSVASVSRFLLFFLYSLTDLLAGIRSFAFSGHATDVSAILAQAEIEDAIAEIMETAGHGSSDYGRSLAGFFDIVQPMLDRRTTVIILGDGRGNRAPPRTEILGQIQLRAKRVIWLNPEPESLWGSGDSDMLRYAPHCSQVTSCNNVARLERAIDDILRQD